MQWLEKKKIKYTSHDIQNEIVKLMALYVLRNMSQILQDSPFLTLMMDETTDVSNKEQVVIGFQKVLKCMKNFWVCMRCHPLMHQP